MLRHDSGAIGIELDENGWVEVDVLLVAIKGNHREIDCVAMRAAGAEFYLSANGVWLTVEVAPEILKVRA